MPELVQCPSCQRQLKVPDTLVNQRVKCPSCGTPFEALPSVTSTPAAPPPPPPPPPAPEVVTVPTISAPTVAPGQRPGKVQAIGIMTLVGGIYAVVHFLAVGGSTGGMCCLWPGLYYGLVMGIMAIVKGAALIGANAANETPPKAIAIMQIVEIINFDIPNLVMGILTLVFLNDPEVSTFFRDPNKRANG